MSELTPRQKLQEVLSRAKASLVDYFRIYYKSASYVEPAPFHHKLSDIMLNQKGHFAIEAFRESGKTSYLMLAYPLYCLQFPHASRQYIVLLKATQTLAEQKLKQIVDSYLSNSIMKLNLRKIITQSAAIFECVVTDGIKDITVRFEAYGKGASIRGLNMVDPLANYVNGVYSPEVKRPSIIIADDVQDYETSLSDGVMLKDWGWFLADVKPLGKESRIILIGNNLGEKCLIERVFEFKDELGFVCERIASINEDGEAVWAKQFSLEFLEKEKDSYRMAGALEIWYRERMCIALSDEYRTFKSSYFQYYDNIPDNLCSPICIALDPAISQSSSSDRRAIAVCGIDEDSNIILLELVYNRWLPDQIIDEMFRLADKWSKVRPVKLGIEDVAFQKMLILEMQKQMRIRNKFYNLEPLKSLGKKEQRIQDTLQPRFAQGAFFHRISESEFENELLTFPKGKHDDLIDSVSMAVSMLNSVIPQKEPLTYLSKRSTLETELEQLFETTQARNMFTPRYD